MLSQTCRTSRRVRKINKTKRLVSLPTSSRLASKARGVRPAVTWTGINGRELSLNFSSPTLLSADITPVLSGSNGDQNPRDSYAESDALTLYLREVGDVALLTRVEETALAKRVRKGDPVAREHMIRANLRLVVKIAREYENFGLPLLDLINEGNIGLMKAVERFDPSKGAKLSTYGSLWIKERIRRALANQSRTIRLPVHVAAGIYNINRAESRLRAEMGHEVTDEEIADHLGLRLKSITKLRRAALRTTSLDAPLSDENSHTVAEVVSDENAMSPSEEFLKHSETSLVRELIGHLPEREARIIRLRFGLDTGSERTLEDLGGEFKLTRERIRQLQNIALGKLRQMLDQPLPSVVV